MSLSDAHGVLRSLDRELWILTATDRCGDEVRRAGLLVTSVTSASIVPELPRVLVSVARHHATWAVIESTRRFVLHLVAPSQAERAWRFGLETSAEIDKVEGLPTEITPSGGLRLADAPAWLECRVETGWDAGDRSVYLAEVVDGGRCGDEPALTVKGLIGTAEPERLKRLGERMRADAALEAEAILRWRDGRSNAS